MVASPSLDSAAERERLEQEVRALCEAGRHDDAAERLVRALGAELFGFLLSLHGGDEGAAGDVFSEVAERLWKGLERFGWQGSVRGWSYVVTRNTSLRYLERKGREARRTTALDPSLASRLQEIVRTATRTFERSGTRDAVARLRDALPAEDRMVLSLRVDRGLAWDEIARIVRGEEPGQAEPSAEWLRRESARLRKRFQLIKTRLLDAAREAGLLGRSERE